MRRISIAIIFLTMLTGAGLTVAGATVAVADPQWTWPLSSHSVARPFKPPASDYGAGHRGIDIRGTAGETVVAVAAGHVSFVGVIDHVHIVVIRHGSERSTYQPIEASVRTGDAVAAAESIGTLDTSGSHCVGGTCLHLGRIRGEQTYEDPLERLSAEHRFRLIDPDGPPPSPPTTHGKGALHRPVGGPVTSAFGMRIHPITGERKLHDGTDFGAACGTPVHAAATGVVTSSAFNRAYGNRVVVRHAGEISTSYNHLKSASGLRSGDRVTTHSVVGHVGSTGLSTGCHLHFMVKRDGHPINPMDLL